MTTPYYERSLSQRSYPGVGDIDDCWVVATIWAVRRQTHQSAGLPNSDTFRALAGDPDDGYKDGGTVNEAYRGATRFWPTVPMVKYQKQYGWPGLVSYLKAGATASIALRSSYLPSQYRFGFYSTHQVAIFYRDGHFYMMNPLQPAGTAPMAIPEAALKSAVYHFANGWVMAVIVPRINLGTFKIVAFSSGAPRPYRRWTRTRTGWSGDLRGTRGFTATATPPRYVTVNGSSKRLSLMSTGGNAGKYIEVGGAGRTYTA